MVCIVLDILTQYPLRCFAASVPMTHSVPCPNPVGVLWCPFNACLSFVLQAPATPSSPKKLKTLDGPVSPTQAQPGQPIVTWGCTVPACMLHGFSIWTQYPSIPVPARCLPSQGMIPPFQVKVCVSLPASAPPSRPSIIP